MKNVLILLALLPSLALAQTSQKITYKTIDTLNLQLEIMQPVCESPSPAIVFFFGGGWNSGTIEQFRPQAEYLVNRGMIAVLADYRVKTRHHTPPFTALMDAKSAMRFVRAHAADYGIDPNRIAASGGSAGGHLAAATAMIDGYNDPTDDLAIDCKPNALILFNPVIDNGPAGYGFERIGEQFPTFSPLHNIRTNLPPTLFFLGTKDVLIPVETAEYFKIAMEKTGNRCDLHLYEGGPHGFFNPAHPEWYKNTLQKTDEFLQSLGYLDKKDIREIVDSIGFAKHDWQMDSIISRLLPRTPDYSDKSWKAVIAPHDDFKYAGEVTMQTLSGVKAKTVILFGVAHKARNFNLEDQLVFGSHTHWSAPYGYIPVSGVQKEIQDQLDPKLWIEHDSMMEIEHSLEALTPFLQYQNRFVEIVPILAPYMDFKRMDEISTELGKVLTQLMKDHQWELGKDLAIVVSNDAVHYGDEDWGGKNMAPFGSDQDGNQKAVTLEHEIINNCLVGEMSTKKLKQFNQYTVQPDNFREYQWTWCGRYALPLGILTVNKLNTSLSGQSLFGELLDYATSIDHGLFPVEDLGMGTTAPANPRHWVGYAGIGYK